MYLVAKDANDHKIQGRPARVIARGRGPRVDYVWLVNLSTCVDSRNSEMQLDLV